MVDFKKRSVPFDEALTFARGSEATYFDAGGVLRTAAVDEPRFTYDPETGEALGLLIEEQRTNLLTGSDKVSTALPTINGTSPDFGVTTKKSGWDVEEMSDSSSTATAGRMKAGLTGNDAVCFSATFGTKNTGLGYPIVMIFKTAPTAEVLARVVVNPSQKSASLVLGDGSLTVVKGPDFVRVSVGAQLDPSDTYYVGVFPAAASSPNAVDNTPSLTGTIEVGSLQVEEGVTFPSSYIKTEGSQVTRAADNCSRTLGAEFNASEGRLDVIANVPVGETVIQLGSESIVSDFDGEKDYTLIYSADPSATILEVLPSVSVGTIKSIRYEPNGGV